jgi:hypothetical protein
MLPLFANPPKEFRPSPFWSWNDDLNEDELVRQVRDFKDKGFGGYFMHSRGGLRTPYLGRAWMRCIAACLNEGKKLDLESWLYDEDRWPSGSAGGLVTEGRDELKSRGLCLVPSPSGVTQACPGAPLSPEDDCLAVFDVDQSLGTYRKMKPAETAKNAKVGFKVLLSPQTNWFNGESYADLMNAEAVESFLRLTYDAYAREFGRDFGEFMPGIFTDEPHIRCGDIPWTDDFPAFFEKRNGYDIVSCLPELFFALPNSPKTRYDFWRTVTRMFVERFSRRLHGWCEGHGIGLTGHYLHEDSLLSQMLHAGAAMPHYEFMRYPGIDHLGRNISDPLTLKQVSSVAHQLGKKRVLCEIFGVSGHSMSFEDQKWIADFHFALGINFICQHLVLYSMKGERKRDYPPTFSYHQPYWPYYRYMNDYLARCSYAVSQGRHAAAILLLHPISTAWTVWAKGNDEAVADYSRRFIRLLTRLLEWHRGFDLGDEMILERHVSAGGRSLRVGQMEYEAVVVPPGRNWGHSTLDLLKKFTGTILFVGEMPTLVDGEKSDEWEKLLKRPNVFFVGEDGSEFVTFLETHIPRQISIADDNGREISDIYCYHRLTDHEHIYFLANTSRTAHHAATVQLAAQGNVVAYDPSDGSPCQLDSTVSNGKVTVKLSLPPAGSAILTVAEEQPALKKPDLAETDRRTIRGPWSFRRTHPNSLTLDFCRLSLNASPFGDWQPVWKARREIRKFFGLDEYEGIQPWAIQRKGIRLEGDNALELLFTFEVEDKPETLFLVVEEGFKWSLTVNGTPVSTETQEWHWDRQFAKVDIRDFTLKGTNEIKLGCNYQWDTEIEDIYLIGDFAAEQAGSPSHTANRTFRLVREPQQLDRGDWGTQGYPFYSGNAVYQGEVEIEKREGEAYLLDLSNAQSCLCRALVNGEEAGLVAWQPWRVDITPFVKTGSNRLEIEVVGTLRNTMGPLHHKAGDNLPWVGPEQFVDEENWTDEYNFVPYGLMGEPAIIICQTAE